MKKVNRYVKTCVLLVLVVVIMTSTALPAMAASNSHSVEVGSVGSSWTNSTEVVNWGYFTVTKQVASWIAGARTDTEKARALYDIALKAKYNTDFATKEEWRGSPGRYVTVGDGDPQEFWSLFVEMDEYLDRDRDKPKWICVERCIFLTGCLRAAGIPAKTEVVEVWNSDRQSYESHAIVAMVLNGWKYWADPTYGSSSGRADRYFKMSEKYYDKYYYSKSLSEGDLEPEGSSSHGHGHDHSHDNWQNAGSSLTKVDVPANYRFPNTDTKKLNISVVKDGKETTVPMMVIKHGDRWYLWINDVCMMAAHRGITLNYRFQTKNDKIIGLEITEGGDKYYADGRETNWTKGTNKPLSPSAQAWRLPTEVDDEGIRDAILIGEYAFVYIPSIVEELDSDTMKFKSSYNDDDFFMD